MQTYFALGYSISIDTYENVQGKNFKWRGGPRKMIMAHLRVALLLVVLGSGASSSATVADKLGSVVRRSSLVWTCEPQ
jgi:hypothetical protein